MSRESALEDFEIFKKHLFVVHPNLYEYITKEDLETELHSISDSLDADISPLDFYRLLAPLQQNIKNGHTMIIPPVSWDVYKQDVALFFPFEVHVLGDQLFIKKNLCTHDDISIGTEILAINNVASSDLVRVLVASMTSDGDNVTFPLAKLSLGFSEWYIDIIGERAKFKVELATPSGNDFTIVDALPKDTLDIYHLERYGKKRMPWYIQEIENVLSLTIKDDYAVLKVMSFEDETKGVNGKKYKKYYKESFKEINEKGIEHLILDLRDNGGGDPKHQLSLLTHLLDYPMSLYRKSYAVTTSIPDPSYYRDDKIKSLNFASKLALKRDGDIYVNNGNLFARLMGATSTYYANPADNLYKGNLYILINGESFSATGEVAGHLRDANRGVFIGQETGGNPVTNSSGRMPILHLPHSGVRIRMSLMCFENNVTMKNSARGVMPDYEITPTIHNIINDVDLEMKVAIELIEEKVMNN